MRKTAVSFTLLLLVLRIAVAQQTFTNADQLPTASGPIKTIRTESFNPIRKAGRWVEGERNSVNDTNYSADKTKVEVINYKHGSQTLLNSELFSFDSQGKILSYVLHGGDGLPTGTRVIYKYGTNGRLSESEHYLLGEFTKRETFSYSPDGRRVVVSSLAKVEKTSHIKNIGVYDGKGKIIEHSTYLTLKGVDYLDHKNVYRYDKNGNLIGYRTYGPRKALVGIVNFSYEFDSRGNWIKQATSVWRHGTGDKPRMQPTEIIKRTITYY